MKIGILTYHRAFNCGAMLQAWALVQILRNMGHQVELPECNCVGVLANGFSNFVVSRINKGFVATLKGFVSLIYHMPSLEVSRYRQHKFLKMMGSVPCDLKALANYDLLVVGSDQVWNQNIAEGDAGLFLGETVPKQSKMVGYGLSFGDKQPKNLDVERIKAAVDRFSNLTVRDTIIQNFIVKIGKPRPEIVLDPTLLVKKEEYMKLETTPIMDKPYLWVYCVGTRSIFELARKVSQKLKLKLVYCCGMASTERGLPQEIVYGVTPERFLSYFHYATATLVCSFHGTAFSLIYGKPFASISFAEADSLDKTRSGTLLHLAGCPERLFRYDAPIDDIVNMLKRRVGYGTCQREAPCAPRKCWERFLGKYLKTTSE